MQNYKLKKKDYNNIHETQKHLKHNRKNLFQL